MKQLIYLILLSPFLCFSQNTKTEKALNQVNSVTEVAGNVIGLFKKKKDKNSPPDIQKAANNKTPSNLIFPTNTNPEEIVTKLYRCTYKKLDEERTLCIWKPTIADLKIKEYDANDTKIMFAVSVDTVLTFNQNGIDNTIIVTSFGDFSTDENTNLYCADCNHSSGFIRLQPATEGKIKPVSYFKLETEMNKYSYKSSILKLDEENIFYSVPSSEDFAGGNRVYTDIFSLDGKNLVGYETSTNLGRTDGGYSMSDTEMKIDKENKIFKIINFFNRYNSKGKLVESKKDYSSYQYGNGTITEINQSVIIKPAATKKTTKKK